MNKIKYQFGVAEFDTFEEMQEYQRHYKKREHTQLFIAIAGLIIFILFGVI